MKPKSGSYRAIIEDLTASGHYCGDPIGKCLRHASITGGVFMKDIHLCIRDSATYAAFSRGEKIGAKFNQARAIPGQLRWRDRMHPVPEDAQPKPILLDLESGVFRDAEDGSFGCVEDVRQCFFVRSEDGKWNPFSGVQRPTDSPHFTAEEDIAKAAGQLALVEETTRTALIEARLGQGKYRRNLIEVWGRCSVTRCAHVVLLRASHIKPWRESSSAERLDKFNGLLLVPNLDAAFDQGSISFTDTGEILISPSLSDESRSCLGIKKELRLVTVYPENQPFLAFHRKLHGFGV